MSAFRQASANPAAALRASNSKPSRFSELPMSTLFEPRCWRRRLVLGTALVAAIGAIAVTPPAHGPHVTPLVTPAFAQAGPAAAAAVKPHSNALPVIEPPPAIVAPPA